MRFSIITITSAVVAAAGTNAIDVAGKFHIFRPSNTQSDISEEIPGYEAIPKAATNKYIQDAPSAIPDFAPGSFEPTYMPEEDLKPSSIQARSVTPTSGTAIPSPVADEPSDDSYEAFMEWMNARLAQGTSEEAEHSHVARSVAPSPSAKVEPPTDGPADDTYEAFVTWMESRYSKDFSEQVKQKMHARDAPPEPQHTTTAATATAAPTDGPADESYEEFVHWMNSRYPQGISEEDEHKNFARSLDEHDEYPSEDYHELNARSVDTDEVSQDQGHEMPDWNLAWNEEVEHHLQARSAEEDYEQESSTPAQGNPIDARTESESEYPYLEETFEEFLARQGFSTEQYAQDGKPTESHEEEPKPQVAVDSKPSVSEVPASPAAAPTPKPTSAVTSSATSSTSASQWSGPMSETATGSSSSATNVQARSVSSHYRFRHHSAHASNSGTVSASSATSSTTTSRKGFFNLPW
ncbi:unnamed protein product [Aureobasidium mustum]|uniref:Uncharacterized protein n=1 Tax=Aureobasidium mustum TaxID=2773714 RepID=A0A9N8JXZ9_9PEZI|nr:unnamed protein product [Aureobasidium mustum]